MMDVAEGKQEQIGVRKIKHKRHDTTSCVNVTAKKYRIYISYIYWTVHYLDS